MTIKRSMSVAQRQACLNKISHIKTALSSMGYTITKNDFNFEVSAPSGQKWLCIPAVVDDKWHGTGNISINDDRIDSVIKEAKKKNYAPKIIVDHYDANATQLKELLVFDADYVKNNAHVTGAKQTTVFPYRIESSHAQTIKY